ncbi:DedA family protein [Peribacillus frigoritolerans]|uniref:DedA family protein n=1 Tax=Peribacillus frigoritolerans TaxID=450367 RepID=UPI00203CD229|nr:DedA family protein [Peribacillus frigoritolerans]MCM3166657.1 DedA family protein [Peribacillus frigoritolerans]
MDIVKDLISNYGYFAIYGLLAIGIIGLPVPDEFMMTFVGYLSSISVLNVQGAFLVSFLGSISGMLVSYFIGKKVGKPFLRKYGKWIKMTPARLEKLEKWFNKYGPWTIIIAYFIPGVRHFASYISGMNGMGKRKYFIFAGAGAFSWCLVFTTFGYFIGVLT